MGGAAPARKAATSTTSPCRSGPSTRPRSAPTWRAHGVEVVEEGRRYGADGDGFSLYVRDPEGNTVELKGPPR